MTYRLILSDPPWRFAVRSPKGEGRSAKNHYSVMDLESIKRLPVGDLADKNSVLLMWVIDPMLREAMEVLDAWGFVQKTVGFYWVKQNKKSPGFFKGLGYYTRANPEQCWLATRGKGIPRISKNVDRLIVAPRGRHSEKPACVHDRIEALFGDVPRLEMFARSRRPGWDVFGNEVEDSITL